MGKLMCFCWSQKLMDLKLMDLNVFKANGSSVFMDVCWEKTHPFLF